MCAAIAPLLGPKSIKPKKHLFSRKGEHQLGCKGFQIVI